MPSTFEPGHINNFSLTISGLEEKEVEVISLEDWNIYSYTSSWSIENNTAGGSSKFDTWLDNPKSLIVLNDPSIIHIIVEQTQDLKHHAGIYILKKEKGVELTRRHVASYTTKFGPFPELILTSNLESGGYVLLPTTFNRNLEGNFNLTVYSSNNIIFKPVK